MANLPDLRDALSALISSENFLKELRESALALKNQIEEGIDEEKSLRNDFEKLVYGFVNKNEAVLKLDGKNYLLQKARGINGEENVVIKEIGVY